MADFTVVLSPDVDGGYSVSCPAMPGAHSQGETRAEALANIREAMDLWHEVASERGQSPLAETPELIAGALATVLGWKAEEGEPLLVETATVHLSITTAAA